MFFKYNSLLTSENYVTRRQSLKLLGEILLDRSNFDVMMKYIGYVSMFLFDSNVLVGNTYDDQLTDLVCCFLQREGEPEDDDEFITRHEREHPVRGVPRVQSVCREPEEAGRDLPDPAQQPREARRVPEELPELERYRPISHTCKKGNSVLTTDATTD